MRFTDPTNMLLPRSTGPYERSRRLFRISVSSILPSASRLCPGVLHDPKRIYGWCSTQKCISTSGSTMSKEIFQSEAREKEKDVFDAWLRERWSEKDTLVDGFY